MFLAHYGVAFAAKRAAPRTSLGSLTFAAQFLDELWPILLLLGIEQVRIVPGIMVMSPLDFTYYPYSHSLVMAIVWGIVIGGVYFLSKRYHSGGWTIGLLVVSHWFLDVPVHGRDLPIWPGASSPKVGWGLWNYVAITYLVELTIYAAGAAAYARSTRARDGIGKWGFRAYALILPILYVASNGPPPSSERALAWTALLLWLFVPWAWWVDKHRDYVGRIRVPIEDWASRNVRRDTFTNLHRPVRGRGALRARIAGGWKRASERYFAGDPPQVDSQRPRRRDCDRLHRTRRMAGPTALGSTGS